MRRSAFWDDHEAGLKDPAYLRAAVLEQARADTVGQIMDTLEESLRSRRMPKTQLARLIGAGEASIRRLFARGGSANPTFDTVVKIAAALGYDVVLEPMSRERRAQFDATGVTATSADSETGTPFDAAVPDGTSPAVRLSGSVSS